MSDTTIIIPDLRTHHAEIEEVIAAFAPNRVIFLGNYFSLKQSASANAATARWLHQSLKKLDRVHLLGDQDLCLGWDIPGAAQPQDPDTKWVVRSIMTELDWAFMKLHCWIGTTYLMTHAGLSRAALPKERRNGTETELQNYLTKAEETTWQALLRNKASSFVRAVVGSSNLDHFQSIPNICQVFGHFSFTQPMRIGAPRDVNVCLSTYHNEFSGPGHCGIFDGKAFRLQPISSLAAPPNKS